MTKQQQLVLVTGGSGFLGAHCIVRLLGAGYRVRTTLRSPDRRDEVRKMVETGGVVADDRLTFMPADLMSDEGWGVAVAGADYVLHTASPFPAGNPDDPDDLVIPARDGTLRILRHARDAGVRRVVVTSSFAAIGYSPPPAGRPYDERDWTDLSDPTLRAYPRSKTVAERAAWDFVAREGGATELSVVNPTAIFGPALGPDFSTSLLLIRSLLSGGRVTAGFGVVDVRDAAELHLLAMTSPQAAGKRFIGIAGEFVTAADIARALRKGLGAAAELVPDPAALPGAGTAEKSASNAQACRLLGWRPRSNKEAIVAAGESIVRMGLAAPAAGQARLSPNG